MHLEFDEALVGRLAAKGITFFHSEREMSRDLPCKVYQITEEWGKGWNQWDALGDHTHDYLQIWYVRRGMLMHTINRKQYKMVRGNLYVVPPFAVHRVDLIPGEEMDVIGCEFLPHFLNEKFIESSISQESFDFRYLEHFLVNEEEAGPKVALTGDTDMEVQRLLEGMLREYQDRGPYFELHLKADLMKLLAILVRAYAHDIEHGPNSVLKRYHHSMMQAISFVESHFHEDLRLEDACRVAMVSKTYFCYLFKSLTGKTFNEYLNDLRLRKAMKLLVHEPLSVSEVALKVGFNDVTYFSRVFRRHTGVSPSKYKKHAGRGRSKRF